MEYHRFKSYDEVILDELQRSFRSALGVISPHHHENKAREVSGKWTIANDAKHNHLKEQCQGPSLVVAAALETKMTAI